MVDAAWMVRLALPPEAPTVALTGSQVRAAADAAQVSDTPPANPPEGVTETVDAVLVPGPARVTGVAAMVKAGTTAGLTVRTIVAEAAILPVAASAPVIVAE